MPNPRDFLPPPPWEGPPIPRGAIKHEEEYLFSFIQPVRDGYYYIVVKSDKMSTAFAIAEELDLEYKTGRLKDLSKFSLGELVLERAFEERLERFGYAHRFVNTWPPPLHQRLGHYGFLPT